MRIVLVGGSAPSTPNFFLSLARQGVSVPLDFVLAGRSHQNLVSVQRACTLLTAGQPITTSIALHGDSHIFVNADLIIIQARFGGLEGREFDESFSLDFHICGDEGLGPGGFSAAWRGWPQLANILQEIAGQNPNAKVVLLSAPLPLYCRCAREQFPSLDLVGLCELPWTTLQEIAFRTDSPLEKLHYGYLGTNHLGFFFDLRVGGESLIEAILESAEGHAVGCFPSSRLIRSLGAYPLKYLELVYERERVLAKQASFSRSRQLKDIAQKALHCFAHGSVENIRDILSARSTPWYEHSLVPFVRSFGGMDIGKTTFFLTTANMGYAKFFRDDDVLEIPHRFESPRTYRAEKNHSKECPDGIVDVIAGYVQYERLATEIICRRDEHSVADVLSTHPWLRGEQATARILAHRLIDYARGSLA